MVQISTCTTYGKYLWESIMLMLSQEENNFSVKIRKKTPFLSFMIKMFFHDATPKTSASFKISIFFFEDLIFRNPKSHLKLFK